MECVKNRRYRKVSDSTNTLSKSNVLIEQIVQSMSSITETRDMYTAGHQKKVSELSVEIAKAMGLPHDIITAVRVAGLLHDIGKISVPSEILTKPSKLIKPEFEIIKNHVEIGYEILKNIDFPWPIAEIVRQHHERVDGTGYPRRLTGDEISLEAKIIAVADVVDAMSSHRPYRPGLGLSLTLDELITNKGKAYDPDVVDACLNVFKINEFSNTGNFYDKEYR